MRKGDFDGYHHVADHHFDHIDFVWWRLLRTRSLVVVESTALRRRCAMKPQAHLCKPKLRRHGRKDFATRRTARAPLIQILLPLSDDEGRPFPAANFHCLAQKLTEKFGGVTSFTRSPAEGRWKQDESTNHDDIVVIEVMTDELDGVTYANN